MLLFNRYYLNFIIINISNDGIIFVAIRLHQLTYEYLLLFINSDYYYYYYYYHHHP